MSSKIFFESMLRITKEVTSETISFRSKSWLLNRASISSASGFRSMPWSDWSAKILTTYSSYYLLTIFASVIQWIVYVIQYLIQIEVMALEMTCFILMSGSFSEPLIPSTILCQLMSCLFNMFPMLLSTLLYFILFLAKLSIMSEKMSLNFVLP